VWTYLGACALKGAVMKFGMALFCFLIIVSLANVRAQDVAVDFDKSVDFTKFKTYSWVAGVPAKNPLVDQQIISSVERQLSAKGMRRVEGGGDLSVLYFAAVGSDLEVSTGRWETSKDWMRQTISGINIKSQMWDVEVGTLVVCLSDASTKDLLWRGTAKATLDKKSSKGNPMEAMQEDAKKVEKKIGKSIEKMFKQYPPVRTAG
jgi:hypothetical protein